MPKLSRLFSAIGNLPNIISNALNTDVDQAAENAKCIMGYYQYRFDISDGVRYKVGEFAIMMDGRDPHSPTSPLIEIGYKGERVLRHSSHVDANGRTVMSREVSHDRSWVEPFSTLFKTFQKFVAAQEFVGTLTPGKKINILHCPQRVEGPS